MFRLFAGNIRVYPDVVDKRKEIFADRTHRGNCWGWERSNSKPTWWPYPKIFHLIKTYVYLHLFVNNFHSIRRETEKIWARVHMTREHTYWHAFTGAPSSSTSCSRSWLICTALSMASCSLTWRYWRNKELLIKQEWTTMINYSSTKQWCVVLGLQQCIWKEVEWKFPHI